MRCNAENGSLLFFLSFLKGGNCSFLDVTYAKFIFIFFVTPRNRKELRNSESISDDSKLPLFAINAR